MCVTHAKVISSVIIVMSHQGYVHYLWYVEVGSHWWQAFPYEVGLVGFQPMHLLGVLLGVYGHSTDPHLCTGPEHTDSNLT